MKKSLSFVITCVILLFSCCVVVGIPHAAYSDGALTVSEFNAIGDFEAVSGVDFIYWNNVRFDASPDSNDANNHYAVTPGNDDNHGLSTKSDVHFERGSYRVKFFVKSSGNCNYTVNIGAGIKLEGSIIGNKSFNAEYCDFVISLAGDYGFAIWFSDLTKNIYVDNVKILRVSSAEVTDDNVQTENGAYIRTDAENSGLLFKGFVDKDYYDGFVAMHTDVKVGMIIAPADFLVDCDFTYAALNTDKSVLMYVVNDFNNAGSAETDGYYGFGCAVVRLYPYNIDRKFSARSFISYTENDEIKFIYAAYNPLNHSRSVYGVAQAALSDAGSLTEDQLTVVNSYYNAVENPVPTEETRAGDSFTLVYSLPKGYFVLDYDRNVYSVSVTALTVDGANALSGFSSGMLRLSKAAVLSITFTVTDLGGGDLSVCPVSGKIYKD